MRQPTALPLDVGEDDDPPPSCCCEFVDRHGRLSHLADGASCDKLFVALCCGSGRMGPLLRSLCLDIDDRIRWPMAGGALHLGFEGALPLVLLPSLAAYGSRSMVHVAALVIITPLALAMLHSAALSRRRRSKFFVSWSAASLFGGHALFTFRVGEHVGFGWWLLATAAQSYAFICALLTRAPAPASTGSISTSSDDTPRALTRCKLCGRHVAGYDHHCLWIDACVGDDRIRVRIRI